MAAPAWSKQVLQNGPRTYLAKYTLLWASGDTGFPTTLTAADPTASGDMGVNIAGNVLYPGTHLKIWRLSYDVGVNLALQIVWDATTPQNAWILNGQGSGKQDFMKQGGLYVPQSGGAPVTGATGKLFFNVIGQGAATGVAGDFVSLDMWLKKDIAQ